MTIVKKDVCLWAGHAKEQGTESLFPNGGTLVITNGEVSEAVTFVPMSAGKDGRKVAGLKPSGECPVWRKAPYGTAFEAEIQG